MPPLTHRTMDVIARTYPREAQERARVLLEQHCSIRVLGCDDWSQEQMERIWLAALKVADGDVERLAEAVRLARTDWRDLLTAAGFGDNLDAHLS